MKCPHNSLQCVPPARSLTSCLNPISESAGISVFQSIYLSMLTCKNTKRKMIVVMIR